MISRKDIVERVYKDKKCISFVCYVFLNEIGQKLRVRCEYVGVNVWCAVTSFTLAGDQRIVYESPATVYEGAALEQIAARCLYSLREDITRDCQQLSLVDFAIGDAIEGM